MLTNPLTRKIACVSLLDVRAMGVQCFGCAYACVVLPMLHVCVALPFHYEHMTTFITFRGLTWFINYMAIVANQSRNTGH